MSSFSDYPYQRPDMLQFAASFQAALERFQQSQQLNDQIAAIQAINELRSGLDTAYQICAIRHTIDTRDVFYTAEQQFFDEQMPHVEVLVNRYYQALLETPLRSELEAHFGAQLFRIAALALRTFSPEIIEALIEENKLTTRYTEILAAAAIPFEGEERNLSDFGPFLRSPDRDMRKRAASARWSYFEQVRPELENIFDQLVKIRHQMALQLGYNNFVELGYHRLLRTDYHQQEAAAFRKQIEKVVVPVAQRIRQQQQERLKLEVLYFYDEPLHFPEGNPTPQGDADWIIGQGISMYEQLSPETNSFIHFMTQNGLMDLVSKKGKAGGGYCTYIPQYGAPFIFSNFNGTSADIDVLTHEVGHAFQVYQSRSQPTSEYHWPTTDAAEIHSMSMEYFTYPYMDLFFGAQATRYRFTHTLESLLFLPYGAAVDEFQHKVYEHPEMSPSERNEAWKKVEETYLPHRRFNQFEHLEAGTWWQTQAHIFQSPFYYIDYVLAQMCAFQFFNLYRVQPDEAFNRYLELCRQGGSKSFLELVKSTGLKSPFEEQAVPEIIAGVEQYLNEFEL